MPYYRIRHITRYRYDAPVRENVTEARMQPRTEEHQRCLKFALETSPRSQITVYEDHLGNLIHHFDIPAIHSELKLTAEALVEVQSSPSLPETLSTDVWQAIARLAEQKEFWDYLHPSRYAHPTPLLQQLMNTLALSLADDPLTVLKGLNQNIYQIFLSKGFSFSL